MDEQIKKEQREQARLFSNLLIDTLKELGFGSYMLLGMTDPDKEGMADGWIRVNGPTPAIANMIALMCANMTGEAVEEMFRNLDTNPIVGQKLAEAKDARRIRAAILQSQAAEPKITEAVVDAVVTKKEWMN